MIVDGNKIAKALEEKLVTELLFSTPKKVCFVLFGENSATEQFIKMKSRVAERVGIAVDVKNYSEVVSIEEAVRAVRALGEKDYDGIVVQLPLTAGLDTETVLDAIPPLKDIDVLGATAKESYAKGKIGRTPPVAQAVREILESYNVKFTDKKIVVAGQGRLVGEPVHLMLNRMKATHDVVDINTSEKEKLSLYKNADIIISGTGVPHGIKLDMIKNGVVLIDAGTSELALPSKNLFYIIQKFWLRLSKKFLIYPGIYQIFKFVSLKIFGFSEKEFLEGGATRKLVGDIDPACAEKASYITPVPGGVGPITIVSLFRNLL